jgi:alpha-L-fucosidase
LPATPDHHRIAPWFPDARFGMFIHWGIYSVLGHGEQPLFRELLMPSEYSKLADEFRAERFDAKEWAAVAKEAEMKYMVLTSKHHDGFCLFDTKTTDYNAVKRGPKRDLIAEYVEACRDAGLRVGIYFSVPDWSVPAWLAGVDRDPDGYRALVDRTHAQVEELVSNYGRIDLMWFDGGNHVDADVLRAREMVDMMRSHQPDLIINNRLSPEEQTGDWGYATPEQRIGGLSYDPWETCMTSTRKFWGYHVCHEDPAMWRTQQELMETFVRTIANGGNLLLNVGPYADGTLPKPFEERMRVIGDWIRRNADAVYGTRPVEFEFSYGGVMAVKGDRLCLFFLYWPGETFSVPGFKQKVIGACFVDGGDEVRFDQESHRVVLHGLPATAPDLCTVVELTFDAPPEAHEWAARKLWSKDYSGLEEWAAL